MLKILATLIILLIQSCLAMAQEAEDSTAAESDSIVMDISVPDSLSWQEYVRYAADSLANARYTQTVARKVWVRRHRRRRKVTRYFKTDIPFTIAMSIYDLTADSLVFSHNADRMMTPASTQKLFTAAAMLDNYSDGFTFHSPVTTHATEAVDSLGNVYLDGDVYVNTSAVPTLATDDATTVTKALDVLGIDSVAGGIVMVDNDQTRRMKTSGNRFVQSLSAAFTNDSIPLSRKASWGTDSINTAPRLLTRIDTPLNSVMRRMLKRSDNAYAEAMLLNLVGYDTLWTYDSCRNVVSALARKVRRAYHPQWYGNDLTADYYNIIDGSGLSHSNKTTATALTDLLRYIYHHDALYAPIMECLPVAGTDGTLAYRMRNGNAYGNVRAKTGTLYNTTTLAGYLKNPEGHDIAFAILINNCTNKKFARSLTDRICSEMVR